MSEYTAEDFAKAMFARHGDGGRAARFAGDRWPWRASTADAIPWLSDEEMARDGWTPVVESRLPEARVHVSYPAVSLPALEAAWEAAEQADECREGDVLIIRDDEDNYLVRRMDDRSDLDGTARILSRAPREPWADLADVLTLAEGDIGGLNVDAINVAALLHERGVRVMGGDDDE